LLLVTEEEAIVVALVADRDREILSFKRDRFFFKEEEEEEREEAEIFRSCC
jgi:hypothetical protein